MTKTRPLYALHELSHGLVFLLGQDAANFVQANIPQPNTICLEIEACETWQSIIGFWQDEYGVHTMEIDGSLHVVWEGELLRVRHHLQITFQRQCDTCGFSKTMDLSLQENDILDPLEEDAYFPKNHFNLIEYLGDFIDFHIPTYFSCCQELYE
jgi:hypothetical protein